MSTAVPDRLHVALVYHRYGGPSDAESQRLVLELAKALRDAGHRPCLLSARRGVTRRYEDDGVQVVRSGRMPEAPLRFRGFTGPLTHVPLTVWELLRGRYDIAHAFSPPDALAARVWRRATGSPVVFTPGEPVERERLADRRLQLALVRRAIEGSDAVTATSEGARDALSRWLMVDAPLAEPGDAAGHERLYSELIDAAAHRRSL